MDQVTISTVSTDSDLATILRWLKLEYEHKGEGFWCNRNLIEKTHGDSKLLVLREDEKAVAFQIGRLLSPGILVVRPDLRGRGYGKKLVKFCIQEAQTNDVCFLHIKCVPETSIPFWEKMGFTLMPHRTSPDIVSDYDYPHAYMLLQKVLDLPTDCSEASVLIQFYHDCAQRSPDARPVAEHSPRACYLKDGRIALERRVIGFHPADPVELVVKIVVEGHTKYFGIARYAEGYGVQNRRPAYCLDVITPRPAANP